MGINLRSVDLNLLTVFDAVMEKGKLSHAAQTLGMTQPAVSNAVARLRLTFNDELFIRARHGMLPTPRAQELFQPIRLALQTIKATLDPERSFDPNTSERTFKMAIGDYGELILLPALLGLINPFTGRLKIETFPEMDAKSLELVKQGQIDFYFDHKPPTEAQLDYCQVSEEEVVVICRKNHPHIKKTLTQQEYLQSRHIILKVQHHNLTMLEDFLQTDTLIARNVLAEVRQYVAIPELITQTDCIATVPKRMAEHYAQQRELTILPFPFKIKKSKAYMIWHTSLNQDQAHSWLKESMFKLLNLPLPE